jgi:hypothetical protein
MSDSRLLSIGSAREYDEQGKVVVSVRWTLRSADNTL